MKTLNTYYCCEDLKRYLSFLAESKNLIHNANKPIQNNPEELILICEYHNKVYETCSGLRLGSIQNPIVILSFRNETSVLPETKNTSIRSLFSSIFLRLPIEITFFKEFISSLTVISSTELIEINVKILEEKILYQISLLKHNRINDIINKLLFPLRIMAYNLHIGLISHEKYETFIFTIKNNPSILALHEIHKDMVVLEKYHYKSLNKSLFLSVSENIDLLIKEIDFLITHPTNEDNIKIIDKVIIVFQNLMKIIGK